MILNMHIRNDYQSFGVNKRTKGRVLTLCERTTTPATAGYPGVTKGQKPGVYGVGDYAWCIKCCAVYVMEVRMLSDQIRAADNANITNIYLDGVRECTSQIQAAEMETK